MVGACDRNESIRDGKKFFESGIKVEKSGKAQIQMVGSSKE
jgi:hypothetical protein